MIRKRRFFAVFVLAVVLGVGLVLVPTGSSEAKCEQTQDPIWATYWPDGCHGDPVNCAIYDYDCD